MLHVRHALQYNYLTWSAKCQREISKFKGLAKLGNIVAETLLRMQMFPNLAARETCVAEINFAVRKQKNVFAWSQKHFCFPDTTLATPENIARHCFRNNVS